MAKQELLEERSVGKNIGLDEKRVEKIAHLLSVFLADIHVLFVKTLRYHWNLVDSRFFFLHELLDAQYKALLEDMDLVAERIRKIGEKAPASLTEYQELTRLEERLEPLNTDQMLEDLVSCYEQLIRYMRIDINKTDEMDDAGTCDMLTQIIREFEKRAWMLRSHLVRS